MEAEAIRLSEDQTDILVFIKDSDDQLSKVYIFPINKGLTLKTSLNQETMLLTVQLADAEFSLTVDRIKLRMFNRVLAVYNLMKESRLEPAPNWKTEFEKMGYTPCY